MILRNTQKNIYFILKILNETICISIQSQSPEQVILKEWFFITA